MMDDNLIDLNGHITPSRGSPMTRALSILLLIGQVLFAVALVIFLIMIIIVAIPGEFRDSTLALNETELDPTAMMKSCIAGAIVVAGWSCVLWIVRKVIQAIMHGDPFRPENVKRLRTIWLVMAGTEFFHILAKFLLSSDSSNDGMIFEVNLSTWFFIFVIAAISEAFRHGAALRAEQELTI